MKKNLLISIVICGFLLFASSSGAYSLLDGTKVGDIDDIIDCTILEKSGDATELDWLQTIIGTGISITEKYDADDGDWNWKATKENINVWALSLSESPEYFYIKTGNIKVYPNYDHFLYKNVDNLDWAVIDLTQWGNKSVDIGKVSHIGTTADVPVPENSTILLLGFGLLGLAGVGRRFQKQV